MSDILLNPVTKKSTDAFIHLPSHGLLIVGLRGSGKTYLAQFIAAKIFKTQIDELKNNANFVHIAPEVSKNQISIEQIRQVKRSSSLKHLSKNTIKQIVFIEQAELLSNEAQNAFLKILEEPSDGSLFILASNNSNQLLPTISSRLQIIPVHPVELKQVQSYFNADKERVSRAWSFSLGYPGLISSFIMDESNNEWTKGLDDAKDVVKLQTYERLLLVNEYSADKNRLNFMLHALSRILSASHISAINKQDHQQMIKIMKTRQALITVQKSLARNGNIKLNLLYLFTSIG